MTEDDIIRMAREAGFYGSEILGDHEYDVVGLVSDLERFANLVAAAEREECAKVCADIGKEYNNEINKKLGLGYELQEVAFDCESAIRARGQYD